MIRATNQLTEKERKAAKALIASCQAYDQTFREPYLSNMLNFDPNMPAFFLYYQEGELLGLLTVYADDHDAHTDEEITVKKDLTKSLMFIEHIIEDCTDVYSHVQDDPYFSPYEFEDEIYDILNNDPNLTPEDLHYMYSTNFPHFGLEDYRKICEDYRMFWYEDEEDRNLKTLDYGKR